MYDEFFQRKFKFRKDYLQLPYGKRSRVSLSALLQNLPTEMTYEDVVSYFASLRSNEKFYSVVEFELISCLIARERENYLEAYIFLYRLIEGISFSIPLIYMSRTKSFQKTFRSLQACMPKSDKEGELLFFRRFIDSHWKSENFYRSTIDINLMLVDVEDLRGVYFDLYKKHAPERGIAGEVEDEQIAIKFPYFLDFLISIRNRYFHFLQGTWQENIESSEIVFPDLFFKPLVDIGLNWIALALFEVIKFDMDNHMTGSSSSRR